MQRFVDLRRKGGRPKAWQQWMEDAAMNAHIITPFIIPYDNLMKLIMEVDTTILKGANEHTGRSPEQSLREFLSHGTIAGKRLDNADQSVPSDSNGGTIQ